MERSFLGASEDLGGCLRGLDQEQQCWRQDSLASNDRIQQFRLNTEVNGFAEQGLKGCRASPRLAGCAVALPQDEHGLMVVCDSSWIFRIRYNNISATLGFSG